MSRKPGGRNYIFSYTVKNFKEGFLRLIFPLNCINCRRQTGDPDPTNLLCPVCLSTVEANIPPFCRHCSRHLTAFSLNGLCSICSDHDFHFDRAWAAADYNDTMKKLLHLFKYGNKTSLRFFLSRLMFSFLETYGLDLHLRKYDALVPVPLHPTRQRERGFNQAHLLAREVAARYQRPVCAGNLVRIRHTPNQAKQEKKRRWTNIHNAFTIRRPQNFSGQNILLIDDLLTTGATVSEAARVLKQAGAATVDVLTVAIAHEKSIVDHEADINPARKGKFSL